MRGERGGRGRDGTAAADVEINTWTALADLMRLVARSEAPQLRLRLVAAIVLTLAGRALGVLAPLALGAAVNDLAAGQGAAVSLSLGFAAFAAGYALIRFLSSAAPQASDVVFAPVRAAAQRRTAAETFAHALSLSLDFHQTKRSGALSRTVERGSRAVDFLLRVLAFNLIPTGLELVLAAGVLAGR
ncbi:MAG: metal ABC transporter permease, partial [Brevundimonas sp.]